MDLLTSMSEADLKFSPSENVGPLWKQFRHMGRVQECYLKAIDSGTIEFKTDGATYSGLGSQRSLCEYLQRLDHQLYNRLRESDRPSSIDWFGEQVSLEEHVDRLVSHEELHHGQWIIYAKLMNKAFPASWAVWGL